MNIVRSLASQLSGTAPPQAPGDSQMHLLGADDEPEVDCEATPSPFDRLAPELCAAVFSQVDDFDSRIALQRVCRAWRVLCLQPAVYDRLYGERAKDYVAERFVAMQPNIDAQAGVQLQRLIQCKRALMHVHEPRLADMVQNVARYVADRAEQDDNNARYETHQRIFAKVQNERDVAVRFLFNRTAVVAVPACYMGWVVLQMSVPAIRSAFGASQGLAIVGAATIGPLAGLGVSGAYTLGAYYIDAQMAERDDERACRVFAGAARVIEPPACFAHIAQAVRNLEEPR